MPRALAEKVARVRGSELTSGRGRGWDSGLFLTPLFRRIATPLTHQRRLQLLPRLGPTGIVVIASTWTPEKRVSSGDPHGAILALAFQSGEPRLKKNKRTPNPS